MYTAETSAGYINWQSMQDPYSSLMQQRDHNRPFKGYGISSSMPPASSYYHGMQYATPSYTVGETYGAHQISSNLVHDYPPLQSSHMHGGNNGMQSPHQSLPVTSTNSLSSHTDPMAMADLASPIHSTTKIKTEPSNQDNSNLSTPSPTAPSTSHEYSAESGDDRSKAGDDEDKLLVPLKKRPLSVPDEQKDGSYWEKRKKNNESAKRSREARRCKEEQIAVRVVYLEQENLQLRTEVSLLKSEIEKLRCMLYNP